MNDVNAPNRTPPLEGLRVVDFTTLLPGPLATLMLRRAGAEVIKIEPPGGDAMRTLMADGGAAFELLNCGKRSLCADLKNPAERDAVKALCLDADVVVEQFRPGVMARLGLGHETLRRTNPALVYCAITGYGQVGPERNAAGHDINYLARSGLFSVLTDADGAPMVPPILLGDVVGGAYPAFANIALALAARGRTGQGAYLDIAMTRGLQALSVFAVAAALAPAPPSTARLDGSEANYRCYRCADGAWLAVGALEPKFWSRFSELVGLDPALRVASLDRDDVITALAARFAERPAADWLEHFGDDDVCCSRVRTLAEVLGELAQTAPGGVSPLPLPLAPAFDAACAVPAPALGEANAEFLATGGAS